MATIYGTINDDVLNGSSENDIIDGYDGNDVLNGNSGGDILYGGPGNDILNGGPGADILVGETGDDQLNGGDGNDRLLGKDGADAYSGGDGIDTAVIHLVGATSYSVNLSGVSTGGYVQGDTFADDIERFQFSGGDAGTVVSVLGKETSDEMDISSSDVEMTVAGKGGDDKITAYGTGAGQLGRMTILGGAGNDLLYVHESGNAKIDGGSGDDSLILRNSEGIANGGIGNDILNAFSVGVGASSANRETFLNGGAGDDTISGSYSFSDSSVMRGGKGSDTLNSRGSRDELYGGDGNDILNMQIYDRIGSGGRGNDIIDLNVDRASGAREYYDLAIDGGKGTDTLNFRSNKAGTTIVVDYDQSKVFVDTPNDAAIGFSFSGIEQFTTSGAALTFVGENTTAPIVEDDNLESNAGKIIRTVFRNDERAVVSDSLGGGDDFDVLGFIAKVSGVMTVTSYRQGNVNSAVSYQIDVEKGNNTLYITRPDGWIQKHGYLLSLQFATQKTAKEEALDTFINDKLVGVFKSTVIDLGELGFSLFRVVYENVDGSNFPYLMKGIADKLGLVGKLIDFTTKVDTIDAAFQVSEAEGLRTSYIEIIDLLTGMAATGAGGFAGTVVGGPVGAFVGGFFSGILYSFGASNIVKRDAGEQYDILLFNQNGGSRKPVVMAAQDTPFDPSDLVFDEDWYAASYADARAAVEGGDYPSYMAYFLKVGIKAGHPPNATAPAITVSDLALDLDGFTPELAQYSAIWKTAVADMVGDDLSQGERALADELNARRGVDANIDAGLSAVANRVARDWVLNQTDQLQVAGFAGAVSDWVENMSNGQVFAETLGGLPGLTAGLDSSVTILGAFTSLGDAKKVADKLSADAYQSGVLLGSDTVSLGIAEFGGVWVVLADTDANADDAVDGVAVPRVKVAGTDRDDVVYAGLGVGDVDMGAGGDRFVGGSGNDRALGGRGDDTLEGAGGRDRLVGGNGNDRLFAGGGNDVLKGEKGDDRLMGGNGRDNLRGGKGDDRMSGGKGADDFVFANKFGDDVITDFNALSGAEDIDLRKVSAVRSFQDLQDNRMEQVGTDVVISIGRNSITLENVNLADLDSGDFIF